MIYCGISGDTKLDLEKSTSDSLIKARLSERMLEYRFTNSVRGDWKRHPNPWGSAVVFHLKSVFLLIAEPSNAHPQRRASTRRMKKKKQHDHHKDIIVTIF